MAIGVLLAVFAAVFRYADQHFYTADTFVENTESLAGNAEIRERIFAGFREEIIRLADGDEPVEPEPSFPLSSNDDEPIFGADPVTDARIERDQAIEAILLDVLDSDLYREVFVDSLRVTQTQIVRTAELEDVELLRDNGPITFDLRRLYPTIYQRLAADEKTALITQEELPPEFGIFPIADRDTTIQLAWSGIRNAPGWRTLTYAGAIVALIGAVAVAERRPSTAIQFGGGMAGSAAVALVVIYIIRALVPILAGGGSTAGPVVAVYASNVWPLVRMMIWLLVLGAVLSAVGAIARFIWPDDWVYSHVSDERGIRSIMRRRGDPEPAPEQQVAAAMPVHYPGYGQPYPPYGPGWAQPYPQPGAYPPPGAYPYPAGPYAQPALPATPYTPGRPTVPVMPVDAGTDANEAVAEEPAADDSPTDETFSAMALDDPSDEVPRVVEGGENGSEPATTTESEDAEHPAEHD